MYKVSDEVMEAISKIDGKGDPVVAAGTTGSGKSAVEEASAKNPVTQSLLGIREASGKGSVTKASTIATDYEMIPEDKLVMSAELHPKTMAECGDDNELLGNVLYSGAKDYFKNPDENLYKAKLAKAMTNLLEHPANDSLGYKLKDIGDDKYNALMEVILKFDVSQVMILYNEMLAKTSKKGQKGVRVFIELLSSRESFREIVAEFWNLVIDFINQEVEELREKLESNGAVVEVKPEGGYIFTALLGEDDLDSEITEILLKSEEGSKEYLLSNVSLIYRGADYIFDVGNKDALTVAEIGDTKIHCISFAIHCPFSSSQISTVQYRFPSMHWWVLFHPNGVNVSSRIRWSTRASLKRNRLSPFSLIVDTRHSISSALSSRMTLFSLSGFIIASGSDICICFSASWI